MWSVHLMKSSEIILSYKNRVIYLIFTLFSYIINRIISVLKITEQSTFTSNYITMKSNIPINKTKTTARKSEIHKSSKILSPTKATVWRKCTLVRKLKSLHRLDALQQHQIRVNRGEDDNRYRQAAVWLAFKYCWMILGWVVSGSKNSVDKLF